MVEPAGRYAAVCVPRPLSSVGPLNVAWHAFGIATVTISATVNATPGATIGIEIKIMATGTSIEAHSIAPAGKTALR
jgi:hypothetical protein